MRDSVQPAVDFYEAVAATLVVPRELCERGHERVAHARLGTKRRGVRRGARNRHETVWRNAESTIRRHSPVVGRIVGGALELRREKQCDVLANTARSSEAR